MTGQSIEHKPISDLVPFVNNARTHDDAQVAEIAASIKEFGFTNPILIDGSNGIIAGHGRLMAARKLGLETVPCIELSHLSDTQKRAYILADNRLAEKAGWDFDLVQLELDELIEQGFDIELTGFDETFGGSMDFDPGSEDDQGSLDTLDPIYVTCPHCGKEFDSREA